MFIRAFTTAVALALLTAGCGARSALRDSIEGDTTSPEDPGRIYVADSGNSRVVRFDDMGGEGWTAVTYPVYQTACGLAVDAEERVYFTSIAPPVVAVLTDFDDGGMISFSGWNDGVENLAGPLALALDAEERVIVADTVANRVVRFEGPNKNTATVLGGPAPGAGVGQFDTPLGVAVSPTTGRILISDQLNRRVVEVDDLSGAGWREWTLPSWNGQPGFPQGVAYDREGRLLVTDFQNSVLHRIDSIAGDGLVSFSSPEIVQISNVTVDHRGRILMVMINAAMTVARMDDMSGAGFVSLGGEGDGVGKFRNPCGIAVR